MRTQRKKKTTKNQKKQPPIIQINVESCLNAIDCYMHKRIKDMMNMSFKVDGLRFKTKTKKETTIVVVTQHICEQFLSSFFLFCSTTNMVCYNFATKNQLEHTIAHKTLDGAQA
jgi:hypothetical protein